MSTTENVATACIPCGVGHISTEAGLLNEAVRFKDEGLTSPEVLDRIAKAIEELNTLERVDLTPEKMRNLQDWERSLAEEACSKSREMRHRLGNIQNWGELEDIAADAEGYYKHLYREYTTKRLESCPTCQIKATETEEEKHDYSEYGKAVSQERTKLLEEIRQARGG